MTDLPTTKGDGSITTYCIEHAKTQMSKCVACDKTIPHKSLRVGEIYRKNKKVKKNSAKHTWYHFKCWKVPQYLTRVPIDQFRGYPTLNEKDKARVQRVIKGGVGSSWESLMEKAKPVKTEEELEADKEEKQKKDKKKKEDEDSMNMDMTENLTGTQQKPTTLSSKKDKKKTQPGTTESKPKKQEKKAPLKAKTDKKSKIVKDVPSKQKQIQLPKEDLIELENFAKEFNAFK